MRNCSPRVSAIVALMGAVSMTALAFEGPQKNRTQVETRVSKIDYPVRYEFSRSVRTGGLVEAQEGQPGVVKRTYRVTYKNGKPVAKELIKEEKTDAVPALFLMSRSGFQTSRGAFNRGKVLTMSATGYHSMVSGTGRTALGMRAGFGHVAVDPRIIPLGSLLYVEGYGFAIASDTGGAIRGTKIDLCFTSRRSALAFGRKKVKVHVFQRRAS